MAKKIKKSIPWFLIASLILITVFSFNLQRSEVKADTAGTSVTVGNSAPSWTVVPADGSDGTTPTNAGSKVTFTAIASDPNGDNYYLAICKTDAITPVNSGPPTCPGGEWAISDSTADDAEASVTYTTSDSDAESNVWYAFVCDYNTSSACSANSNAASPFKVNHRPNFTWQENDGPKGPATTITISTAGEGETTATYAETAGTDVVVEVGSTTGFAVDDYVWYTGTTPERAQITAVSAGASLTMTLANDHSSGDAITEIGCEDTDTDTAADTVSLFVCKSDDFTGTACGASGTWCSDTGEARNPSCSWTTDRPDGSYSYYPYVIDSHDFASNDSLQGSTQSITVSNVAPSISNTTIELLDTDETGNLTLTTEKGETQGFKVKFTVVDDNSCENITGGDEIASALINVYRSGIGQANCDDDSEDDNNNCYANAQAGTGGSCTQTGTCGGTTDTDIEWTCTFPLEYHADPTVSGSKTAWESQNWLASVKATDDDSADTGLVEDADGNELGLFMAYDVDNGSASINYGTVSPGGESAEQSNTMEATGNVGLDETLYGTDMTGAGTIAVGQQHYNLTSGQGWSNGTALLVDPGTSGIDINVPKTTTTATPASEDDYWVLKVPDGTVAGSYSGTNTIIGETGDNPDSEW